MKKEFEKNIKSEKLKDLIKYAYLESLVLEWWELENPKEFVDLTNKFASSFIS
jgi:hypothetical protein